MKYFLFTIIGFLLLACNTSENKEVIDYKPEWESLKQHETPEWFNNSKFGIYFHWGPYSVPAYETEWYSILMYNKKHAVHKYHKETYGTLEKFGYKDFIPMFSGEHFNANEWAELFKKAGAQFAGPCAEHADGFAMWDSELTEWNSMQMGPKLDVVAEMEKAVRAHDMKFLITYHRHWLYAWYPTWDTTVDAGNPEYGGLYGPYVPEGSFVMATGDYPNPPKEEFHKEWLARLNELMDKYEPDMIWFDNKMDIIDEQYRKQFLANFYNNAQAWGRDVVCTYKFTDMAEGSAVLDLERARMSEKKDFPWLTDDSIDWKAWCHINDPNYKTTNRLIDFMVDVVSKNGCVLLNITPKANGEIPVEVQSRLLEMGEWLEINGEAIYDTRTWKVYGEGPQEIVEGHLSEDKNADAVAEDIRFTTKGNTIYAIALDWPEGKMVIKSFAKKEGLLTDNIQGVSLLGYSGDIEWQMTDQGLEVTLPESKPCEHAFALKVDVE